MNPPIRLIGKSIHPPQNLSRMKIFFAFVIIFAPLSQLSVAIEKEFSEEQISKKSNPSPWLCYRIPILLRYPLKLSKKWGNGDLRHYFFEQTRWVRDNQSGLISLFLFMREISFRQTPRGMGYRKRGNVDTDGHVPYCLCLETTTWVSKSRTTSTGSIAVNRTTHFNKYFPRKNTSKPGIRRNFDPKRHDNQHFNAAGLKFLIVSLNANHAMAWLANKVVTEHPDHRVIVLTQPARERNGKRFEKLGYKIKGNAGEGSGKNWSANTKISSWFCAGMQVESSPDSMVITVIRSSGTKRLSKPAQRRRILRPTVFEPTENKIKVYTYNRPQWISEPTIKSFRPGVLNGSNEIEVPSKLEGF